MVVTVGAENTYHSHVVGQYGDHGPLACRTGKGKGKGLFMSCPTRAAETNYLVLEPMTWPVCSSILNRVTITGTPLKNQLSITE